MSIIAITHDLTELIMQINAGSKYRACFELNNECISVTVRLEANGNLLRNEMIGLDVATWLKDLEILKSELRSFVESDEGGE